MKDFRLAIEYLPVEALKPYERNTRRHEDFDVEQIATSIKQYGFDDPIGIWGKDNLIVEGHGRLMAAKKLGMDEVPCIRLDHLTEKERRAYAIAHNKTAELSSWDEHFLALELPDLDLSAFEFSMLEDEEDEEEEEPEERPQVEFSEALGEENNYLVLQFKTDVDWLNALSLFELETVKACSTRRDGKVGKHMERRGLGRVLDGAKALKKLMGE